jgi:hypothetical protein
MSGKSRWDYLKAIYFRYKKVSKPLRARILDEFCQVCGYNRKYAFPIRRRSVILASGLCANFSTTVGSTTSVCRPLQGKGPLPCSGGLAL